MDMPRKPREEKHALASYGNLHIDVPKGQREMPNNPPSPHHARRTTLEFRGALDGANGDYARDLLELSIVDKILAPGVRTKVSDEH